MGNANQKTASSRARPCEQQLQILYESELGQVTQQISTTTQYLIRELSFSSPEALSKTFSTLSHFQRKPHPTFLSLLHIEQKKLSNMCGSQYKLRLVFEYSSVSIYDEIEARKRDGRERYFDFGDCCRMVAGCVRALKEIQGVIGENGKLIGDGVLNRVFVNPQRIFIMKDGLVKIMSPLVVSPYDRFHHKHNCYYSPEKLIDFDYPEDEKSALFELGLTFLHILTLEPCTDIYNGFQVKQDEIDKRILKVWELFRDTFLCEILSKMTRTFRAHRINLKECLELVDFLEVRMMEKECFGQIALSQKRKQQKSNLKSEIYIEEQSQSPYLCQDYEEDKQNVMLHSNKRSQSLKYSQFSSPDLKVPMARNQPKQSCVITNESPLFNMAMIASDSLSGKGKQSYCYGNQLAEGLIPSDTNRQEKKFEWKRTQFNKKQNKLSKRKQKRRANLEHINELMRTEIKTKHEKISTSLDYFQQIDIHIERRVKVEVEENYSSEDNI